MFAPLWMAFEDGVRCRPSLMATSCCRFRVDGGEHAARRGKGTSVPTRIPPRIPHGLAMARVFPSSTRVGHDGGVTSDPVSVSPREAEVLAAVRERLSNTEIATKLYISVRTVESHVSSLLRKFGVADRWALVERARLVGADAPAVVVPAGVVGVPATWTTFIGRDRERELVLAALADARLVTLAGPGGVGKTRLAVEVAEAATRLF